MNAIIDRFLKLLINQKNVSAHLNNPSSNIFCITDVISDLEPLCIIDIGAMAIDGQSEPYAPLGKKGLARIIGFDASESECKKLAELTGFDNKYLPYVIFDGSCKTFYITESPSSSSIFEPNTTLLGHFHDLPPMLKVARTEEVQTTRLDDVRELDGIVCDYLKLDIQGAELGALRNGEKTLETVLVVHTEVEFLPLYYDQPLFADVDQYLRTKGFVFHRFQSFGMGSFDRTQDRLEGCLTFNQLLWADAVYVRDFSRLETLSALQLLKMSAILHEIYGSFDLCHLALSTYDRLRGTAFAEDYSTRVLAIASSQPRHYKGAKMLRATTTHGS